MLNAMIINRNLSNEKQQSQRRIDQLSDKISVVLTQSDKMKQVKNYVFMGMMDYSASVTLWYLYT